VARVFAADVQRTIFAVLPLVDDFTLLLVVFGFVKDTRASRVGSQRQKIC
jgi:hypothetical protein